MAIFRHHHDTEYVILPNSVMRDTRLTPKDLGLLCFMLSLPENWDFSLHGLESAMGHYGKSALSSTIKNLEQCGYLRRTWQRAGGKYRSCCWDITDVPGSFPPYPDFPDTDKPDTEKPDTDKPDTDKPDTENQPQIKKRIKKEQKKQRTECGNAFTPPTLDEIRSYCSEKQLKVDAERFHDYYASVGWKIGIRPMADWKAALRRWDREDRKEERHGTSASAPSWAAGLEV